MNTENTGSTGLCGRKTRICVTTHAKDNDARDANVRNNAPLTLKRSHHVGNPHHRLQINEVSIRGRGARTATLAEQVGAGGAPDADGRLRYPLETYVLAHCAKTNSRGVREKGVCNRKRGYRVCAPEGAQTQSRRRAQPAKQRCRAAALPREPEGRGAPRTSVRETSTRAGSGAASPAEERGLSAAAVGIAVSTVVAAAAAGTAAAAAFGAAAGADHAGDDGGDDGGEQGDDDEVAPMFGEELRHLTSSPCRERLSSSCAADGRSGRGTPPAPARRR